MSKRINYHPSIVALMSAIENFDKVAVQNNDAFARKQYHELVDIVHVIKTHITEEENGQESNKTSNETSESLGQRQSKGSSRIEEEVDYSSSGC